MNDKEAKVYVSENCQECKALLDQLTAWNISCEVINVSKGNDKMSEMQNKNVYGTPATFIEGLKRPILGFQKNKLKDALNILT